jgi:hypothetical protein
LIFLVRGQLDTELILLVFHDVLRQGVVA